MDIDVNAINLAQLQELVGIQAPSYEMDVERGKIREFARSVYSNHPA